MIVQINVGAGWVDISDYVEKYPTRTLKLHKDLSPTINTFKCTITNNTALMNSIMAANTTYIRAFEDDGVTYRFYGTVESEYKIKVSSRVEGMDLDCVDLSWMFKTELEDSMGYDGCYLMNATDQSHSLVHLLLQETEFPTALISPQELSQTVDYFYVEAGETVEDILKDLFGEFGYVYNVEVDGTFQVYPFVPDSVSTSSSLDNSNLYGTLTVEKNEAQAKSVTVNYRPVGFAEDRIVASDTTGGNDTYKSYIEVPASGVYPSESDTEDVEIDFSYDNLDIIRVENAALDISLQNDLSVLKFTPGDKDAIISIQNSNNVYSRYIKKLDIRGDVYYLGDYNSEYVHNGAFTEETEELDVRFVQTKANAALLAQKRANYWKYAAHNYEGKSKTLFALGAFVSLVDTTLGLSTTVQIIEIKDKNKGEYTYTMVGVAAYEVLPVTGGTNKFAHSSATQETPVNQIIQEISEGYDLIVEGEEIGTTIPDAPTLVCQMDKRNARLYFSMQGTLTPKYHWDVQVSEDSVNWYAPYNYGTDWKTGAVGGYGTAYFPAYVHSNIPNVESNGLISSRTLFWRVRVHLENESFDPYVSAWSNAVTGATTPISYEDMGPNSIAESQLQQDSVSENILQDSAVTAGKIATGVLESLVANIHQYITISESGFVGANYDLSEAHLYTTADRRAFIDQDELTFQAVSSVTDNAPTWTDTIKLGGVGKDLEFFQAGSRVGYGLDTNGIHYYSPYKTGLTSSLFTLPYTGGSVLAADAQIAIAESDTGNVVGTFDTNAAILYWGGDVRVTGEIKGYGAAYWGDDKEIVRFSDNWLRLNPDNDFSSGIYCGTGLFRTDGKLQVGNGAETEIYQNHIYLSSNSIGGRGCDLTYGQYGLKFNAGCDDNHIMYNGGNAGYLMFNYNEWVFGVNGGDGVQGEVTFFTHLMEMSYANGIVIPYKDLTLGQGQVNANGLKYTTTKTRSYSLTVDNADPCREILINSSTALTVTLNASSTATPDGRVETRVTNISSVNHTVSAGGTSYTIEAGQSVLFRYYDSAWHWASPGWELVWVDSSPSNYYITFAPPSASLYEVTINGSSQKRVCYMELRDVPLSVTAVYGVWGANNECVYTYSDNKWNTTHSGLYIHKIRRWHNGE